MENAADLTSYYSMALVGLIHTLSMWVEIEKIYVPARMLLIKQWKNDIATVHVMSHHLTLRKME